MDEFVRDATGVDVKDATGLATHTPRPLCVVVLGGIIREFHNFAEIGPVLRDALTARGLLVELTEDRDVLLGPNLSQFDVHSFLHEPTAKAYGKLVGRVGGW